MVTIVIPVFNDGEVLEKNLQNLLKISYPNFEILVIYSMKSTDRTEEVARKFSGEYKNIRAYPENISKGNAANIGIDKANGEYILFLDSDTFIYHDFIENAIKFFSDPDVMLVSSCFLGLNSTQNIVTKLSWSISNYISFTSIGSNRIIHQINFMGFGGIWRRSALIKIGKFATQTSIEDAEINLRACKAFPKWKGIFDNNLYCYQFYATTFTSFYLQMLRWTSGNLRYVLKALFQLKAMGSRQKFIYISQFLLGTLFPMIGIFSMGMIFIQFLVNFFIPNFQFGGGLFFLLMGFIALIISIISLMLYSYPKYHGKSKVYLSLKFILFGIFINIYVSGLIFGIVALNSLKEILSKKKEERFYKVDKTSFVLDVVD